MFDILYNLNSLLAVGFPRLGLLLTTRLLHAVLGILLRAASLCGFLHCEASPFELVLRLEFLHLVDIFVDEPEARASTATKLRLETEKLNALAVFYLVHTRKFGRQVLLRYVGRAWVNDVKDELLPAEKWVLLKFTRTDGEVRHPGRLRNLALELLRGDIKAPLEPKW